MDKSEINTFELLGCLVVLLRHKKLSVLMNAVCFKELLMDDICFVWCHTHALHVITMYINSLEPCHAWKLEHYCQTVLHFHNLATNPGHLLAGLRCGTQYGPWVMGA